MTKECWLFLDCQVMTGYQPSQCPNYKNCQHNAIHSINRACAVPYHRFIDDEFRSLEVCVYVEPEAIAAGWHTSVRLPYRYKPGCLEVGIFAGDLIPYLEKDAIAAGYAIAKDLPYIVLEHKRLVVKYSITPSQKEAGWLFPVDLPYRRKKNPKRLEVYFDYMDANYREAVAAGWYPAEPIDQEEFPW